MVEVRSLDSAAMIEARDRIQVRHEGCWEDMGHAICFEQVREDVNRSAFAKINSSDSISFIKITWSFDVVQNRELIEHYGPIKLRLVKPADPDTNTPMTFITITAQVIRTQSELDQQNGGTYTVELVPENVMHSYI